MRSCARSAVVLVLLTLLAGAPAAAQFKPKLPKIGGIGGKSEAAQTREPKFNERVLEITDERLNGLLSGYKAELAALDAADKKHTGVRAAYEEENRQYPAKLKAYEAEDKKWRQCQDTYVKPAEEKGKQDAAALEQQMTGGDQAAYERRMKEVAERIKAAQANGDMAEVMRLSDSISRAAMPGAAAANQISADMQAAASRCGAQPERPEPPRPPSYPDLNLDQAGAAAAGMTAEQYAIMKERVRYAVREEGKVEVTSNMWAFSKSELKAMEKRGSELYSAAQALEERGH